MKAQKLICIGLLFTVITTNAQKYIEGTLFYTNGEEKSTLIHKKIEGTTIKIRNKQGKTVKIESSNLKRIIIAVKKGNGEVWYEYLHIKDHEGRISKNPAWLNKIIDGEMSLYKESFIFVGNPAGSGSSWYFKRKNEKQALLLSPLRLKKQLAEYFKDYPELVGEIKSGEVYDPREMVMKYNKKYKL